VVPTTHKGDCKNLVLERNTKTDKRWTYGSSIPPMHSKKGGITHQTKSMQIAAETIATKIRQAYKLYLQF